MILTKAYTPPAGAHRLTKANDVAHAREFYYQKQPTNLVFLLRERYEWMNDYIKTEDRGIEVGCGAGFSKDFIKNKHFLLTDFADFDWLDKKEDALHLSFEDASLDYIIASNMIHHLASPHAFLTEAARVLRPDGKLLIQEVHGSLLLRLLLKLLKHEGYDYGVNVFDPAAICCDPNNLWAGNNVIPNLLFANHQNFEAKFPFEIKKDRFTECLVFLASGGVTAKSPTLPLPIWALKTLRFFDTLLNWAAPNIFALQRQIVLVKKGN
jgi:SAM-dependent methyltransferase